MDGFSGAVGRIPWTAIDRYAARYPNFDEEFDLFNFFISALDTRFIELVKEKKPKPKPKDGRKTRASMGEPEG